MVEMIRASGLLFWSALLVFTPPALQGGQITDYRSWITSFLPGQEQGKHSSPDPQQCTVCKPALDKAIAFVRANYKKQDQLYRQVSSHFMAGMMFLIEGKNDPELKNCVKFLTQNIYPSGSFNKNWYLGLTMYFLSEIQLRQPDAGIKKTLTDALKHAKAAQEPTGGWAHHLGMVREPNYARVGGAKDLGSLTTIYYAAFWNMKTAGIEVPDDIFNKAEENLKSISDGYGFNYGTGNKLLDVGMSRGSFALLGLINAKQESHAFYAKIAEGIEQRFTRIEEGHSYAPINFFSTAAAMHRLGKYRKFTDHWLDKLLARQNAQGTLELVHDGNSKRKNKWDQDWANAATLAILILLQKEDAFPSKK